MVMRGKSGGDGNVGGIGDAAGHVVDRFAAVMTEFDVDAAGVGVLYIDSVWQGELRG